MGLIFILIGAIAIVVLVTGFGLGIFRLESVNHGKGKQSDLPDYPSYPTPNDDLYPGVPVPDDPYADPVDGASSGEENPEDMVDLFDYFAEEEEEEPDSAQPPSAEAHPAGSTAPEETDLSFDKLCGFKTGHGYLTECQRMLDTARNGPQSLALAYLDFDRFRFINSLKGASIGDYALSRLSQALPTIFPDNSVFTRVSADHFTVLFPVADPEIFEEYASQLRALSDRIREDIGAKSGLYITIGFATAQLEEDYNIGVLMHKANLARHCLKMTRTETFSIYDSSMVETFLYGESAMEDYNDNQYEDSEYMLKFLPLYDMRIGRITGCETLVRWAIEDSGNKDLPLTSDNGKIPSNNLKVFYQACRHVSRWRKAGKEVTLDINNLPATDFFKSDIDDYLARCINAYQLDPHTIAVQIDAAIIQMAPEQAAIQLKKIRDIGVSIVVCGLDASYTSLDFLTGLPVKCVKFHKSISQNIDTSPQLQELVNRMIQSAGALSLRTIFEGVDTQQQGDALQKSGARYVSGRYGGNVAESDDFIHLLQETASENNLARGVNSTVILDDATLARGDFSIY